MIYSEQSKEMTKRKQCRWETKREENINNNIRWWTTIIKRKKREMSLRLTKSTFEKNLWNV